MSISLYHGDNAATIIMRQRIVGLDKAERRIAELDVLFQKLFEGNAAGRICDERFDMISAGYEAERHDLKKHLAALSAEVRIAEEKTTNTERFLGIAGKYTDLWELTPTILRELVSGIVMFEPEKLNGKKRRQKIQIYFNFIGALDPPEDKEMAKSA